MTKSRTPTGEQLASLPGLRLPPETKTSASLAHCPQRGSCLALVALAAHVVPHHRVSSGRWQISPDHLKLFGWLGGGCQQARTQPPGLNTREDSVSVTAANLRRLLVLVATLIALVAAVIGWHLAYIPGRPVSEPITSGATAFAATLGLVLLVMTSGGLLRSEPPPVSE